MSILNEKQIREGYFCKPAGALPSLNYGKDSKNYAREVKDFKGQEKLYICCTQLENHIEQNYSECDKKRILSEWIDFLRKNVKTFKSLHFNSHVPQKLFDAACCQEDLEELSFKWGSYQNLSTLENLQKLKYLYIGPGAGVREISPLGKLKNLIVLYVENFKRIEDYSQLVELEKLEQLIISGPILGKTKIKDLDFLQNMNSLISFWKPNTTLIKKYTLNELETLKLSLSNITFMYNSKLYKMEK